jgi:hypothetical protein
LLAEVPTIAIDLVDFENNTVCCCLVSRTMLTTLAMQSVLTDEFLAHRLGLIPLSVPPRTLEYSRFCTCTDYCPRCSYVLSLDVKCSAGERKREVSSKDLVCSDPGVVPIGAGPEDEYGVLIAKLGPGQVCPLLPCLPRVLCPACTPYMLIHTPYAACRKLSSNVLLKRGLPKSTLNGLPYQRLLSSMIPTMPCGTRRFGTRTMSRRSGRRLHVPIWKIHPRQSMGPLTL